MATPKQAKTLPTPIHPSTHRPRRNALPSNNLHVLPTSLPNSPLLSRRMTLASNSKRPTNFNIQHQSTFDLPDPPLPPRPRNRTNSVGPFNTHTLTSNPNHTMWLIELSNCNDLPVQIQIMDGLNGPYFQPQQLLNIHFTQCMEVCTVLDSKGMKYYLPLNSSVRFGFPSCSKFVSKKVSDLLTLPNVPRVISPQITVSKKQHTYADKGEILIVYEVSEQSVKCYSQQKKTFVTLEHDLKGNFTTDPVATQVVLKDLTDVIPNAFPCEAKIFLPTQIQSTVPAMQSGSVVTISEQTFITSLVATTVDKDNVQYLLIPMIGDMGMANVRLIQNVKTNQHLLKMTQHINSSFKFTDFTFTRNITDSNVCNLQTQLFKEAIQSTEDDDDDVYVRMFSPIEINTSSDEDSIYDVPCEIISNEQKNKDFLASLDILQMQELLDKMGLTEYKELFLSEKVAGDILLQCCETTLKDELHITKHLHRIRLMKLIDGSHSAQKIMDSCYDS